MAQLIFEVQVVDRQTGKDRWLKVSAANADDAARRVAEAGEIVGQVRLLEVPPIVGESPDAVRRKLEADIRSAMILAIVSFFVCGPATYFTWWWLGSLDRRAEASFPGEKLGHLAHRLGAWLALIWTACAIAWIILISVAPHL